jgi:energy-coupling factor transport system ATP-binding protein
MGANGAGKTTFCHLLTALAPQMTKGEFGGDLLVLGERVVDCRPGALAGRVGITFQEVEHQLFNATVEAEVAWGLEAQGLPPAEIEERIRWALAIVGLKVERSRSPATLSGGQGRRLALAVALAPRPELLVLDEPFSGLDPAGRREVQKALETLRGETTAAILMTESNAEMVAALADRVAVLDRGRIGLEGTPQELFAQTERLEEMGVAVPQLARLAAAMNARHGTGYHFLTVDEAEEALVERSRNPVDGPRPDRDPEGEKLTPGPIQKNQGSHIAAPALGFEDLSFSYPDSPPALRGIDLTIPAGQFVALVGANGSGKTTLTKHVIGLLRPTAGRVWVGGQEAAELSIGQLARQVGYLFQHPERQIFASTVRDEVAFGPRNLILEGSGSEMVEAQTEAALARFGLQDLASSPPAVLSYAMRRLVTLASVAAMEPSILVLDEPTVGLDAPGRAITLNWAHERHAAGCTVILVTHDMAAAAAAERMLVLEEGELVADGPPAEIFRRPPLLARAALRPPPIAALAYRLGLPADILDVESFVDAFKPELRVDNA